MKILNFSIDYDGFCEDVEEYSIDGKDLYFPYKKIMNLIDKLKQIPGFFISPHRTEVKIKVINGNTFISFDYFNSPDSADITNYKLDPINSELI